MKSDLKPHTLQKLADAYLSHALGVNREYQRGTKWTSVQNQGLIDSLLRGYQIPLFFPYHGYDSWLPRLAKAGTEK